MTKTEIFLIDFGLAKSFKETNGCHIKNEPNTNPKTQGNEWFASVNVLKGNQFSRRDDLA